MRSALYVGVVTHARLRPKVHRLRYRIAQGLFDLDELPDLGRRLRLFAHNRPGVFSFQDADHGDGSGDLRGWVEAKMRQAGRPGTLGAIRVLCLPRMLGYGFNPLSVYFCHAADGGLVGLVYEVNNTFGERHAYALRVDGAGGLVRQSCEKAFYVSPFMEMGLRYDFTVLPPGEAAAVDIAVHDGDGLLLDARFAGERRPLDDRALAGVLIGFPLMTLKVIAGIHWEALKLWVRGVPSTLHLRRPHREAASSEILARHR